MKKLLLTLFMLTALHLMFVLSPYKVSSVRACEVTAGCCACYCSLSCSEPGCWCICFGYSHSCSAVCNDGRSDPCICSSDNPPPGCDKLELQ